MVLWWEWWKAVQGLRGACSCARTFLWMAVTLAGLCVREDLLGVTSLVRVFGLKLACYDRLLDFFHSNALDPERLARQWTPLVLRLFPTLLRIGGRLVLLADGIKIPKSGRKMPAVKRLKQVESNTKPAFILGHSCQAISAVAGAEATAFAVPLAARIHEGVFSNRDGRRLPIKLFSLLASLGIREPVTLVADAFYACRTLGLGLLASGSHLVSRVRNNAVAYLFGPASPAPPWAAPILRRQDPASLAVRCPRGLAPSREPRLRGARRDHPLLRGGPDLAPAAPPGPLRRR